MTRIPHMLPTGTWSFLRTLLPMVVTTATVGCGFAPQPKSGTVVCKPQGGACCPESYVCVGRGLSTAGGPAAGTCWSPGDLPLEAVVAPAAPNLPACLVTDWLPPEWVGLDRPLDASVVDSRGPGPTVVGTGDAGPSADGSTIVKPAATTRLAAEGSRTYLVSNGKLLAWGKNTEGRLGDGTTMQSNHPVVVSGLESGVTSVSTSSSHTCAVVNGGVQCWGYNKQGQLGNATTSDSIVPVPVVGLSTGVAAVAAGGDHTCAVVNGGVQCWGFGLYGQIGDGTRVDSTIPVKVPALPSGVTAIAAGEYHTCALVNGGVRCWGGNDEGQLGDSTQSTDRKAPVAVVGLDSGVTAISAGYEFTCALVDGGLRCWGANGYGQLGDGSKTNRLVPVQVVGLSAKVAAVDGGGGHACAIVDNGAARCWGANFLFQLGDGTDHGSTTPVQVVGLTSGVQGIAAAANHSCALLSKGVKCWGFNGYGELGVEDNLAGEVPVEVQFR